MRPAALCQPLIMLCVAILVWPLPGVALPFGVIKAKASVEPEQIALGEKTQVTVKVSDGFDKPILAASIKISTATGYFETSNQNIALGSTDKEGVFQAVWHSNLRTELGPQVFEITATKNGYVGKYPVTETVTVRVGDQSQEGILPGTDDIPQ